MPKIKLNKNSSDSFHHFWGGAQIKMSVFERPMNYKTERPISDSVAADLIFGGGALLP